MGGPEHVVNFLRFIAEDLRQIMARLGFRIQGPLVVLYDIEGTAYDEYIIEDAP